MDFKGRRAPFLYTIISQKGKNKIAVQVKCSILWIFTHRKYYSKLKQENNFQIMKNSLTLNIHRAILENVKSPLAKINIAFLKYIFSGAKQ